MANAPELELQHRTSSERGRLGTLPAEDLDRLPARLSLEPRTLHVWAFTLTGSENFQTWCYSLLQADECERADRYVHAADRTHFTIARAMLRLLLGRYLGSPASTVDLVTTRRSKPRLRCDGCAPPMRFNLTHSHGRAILAASAEHEIGVDLEKIRRDFAVMDISNRYFFGFERDAVQGAAPEQIHAQFFKYWVAKEAVLKAEGTGLGIPLDHFGVCFHADGLHASINTLVPRELSPHWSVRMLPYEAGWAAAVAAQGEDWLVKLES